MHLSKYVVVGLVVGAIAVGLSTATVAQNTTNWHVLSNGVDVIYGGVGAGAGQTGGIDGIGSWIDGNDLRGNHPTVLGQFGYRQVGFIISACVLGPNFPGLAIEFPLILTTELDGRNNNRQDVFTRPGCSAGGFPTGADPTDGFLAYGAPPGSTDSFLVSGLRSVLGLPSSTAYLLPNNGLVPTSAANGATAALIAGGSGALAISSTGYCWNVYFTWAPSSLVSFDHIDGWWMWFSNSAQNNQYWGMSNNELNAYSSNSVLSTGGLTGATAFFSNVELTWFSLSADPTLNTALSPSVNPTPGSYYVADDGQAPGFNPNGGWDLGRHGGVSLTGLGGTWIGGTMTANQDPGMSGLVPAFGYHFWDNGPHDTKLRTVMHQLDWQGIVGDSPDAGGYPDIPVGPPGAARLPIGNTSAASLSPVPGPVIQPITVSQQNLMFHLATTGHPNGSPVAGFSFGDRWGATNMIPLAAVASLAPCAAIGGLPFTIDGGSVALNVDMTGTITGYAFSPSKARISVSTSINILD